MPVNKPVSARLEVHFASLTDPRRRKFKHPLINFIVIAIRAVICGADDSPAEFDRCLLSWIQTLHEATGGQVIAIDGKTLRGSFDKASSKSAIHMISAWASANSISLGQLVVDAKSNEINAIPKLLDML